MSIKKFDQRKRPITTKTMLRHAPTTPLVGIGVGPLLAQVGVGIGAASFWRGAWYILDDNLFPHNALHSATASLGLGTMGLALTQGMISSCAGHEIKAKNQVKLPTYYNSLARFGALYGIAMSAVLIWRGSWMLWDIGYEKYHKNEVKALDPDHLTKSGIASHLLACGCLLAFGRFSSVLAPPAKSSILTDKAMKVSTWKEYLKYFSK